MQGLIGKKIGMTQVWDDNGVALPVTVVEIGPCPVVQVKTVETDGYVAAQLGFVPQKAQRLSKAARTRFEKAGVEAQKILAEFTPDSADEVKAGDVITAAALEGVAYVDVQATTKGRGFAGVVRRFGFAGGPHGHGGHSKRRPGGIAARDLPGWVEKGKKMPGHMGCVVRTTQNVRVVKLIAEENLILLHGAVPGPNGGIVRVTKALKKASK
ncbi:MAG: 50S ribosomal protein L3 [Kiritimatiellae bacterium]|nr:50S ribosomal protein L3 [Kiritimatiellia bacterium]